MAREHELKTWPPYFEAIADGRKRFEVRLNDRDFRVGDWLRLREYDPATGQYPGREMRVRVTYILFAAAVGIPTKHCIMSIEREEAGS